MKGKRILIYLFVLVIIFLLPSCAESAPPDTWAGEWTAVSEFGEFTFIVNDTGTTIYHLNYQFHSCSEAIIQGDIEVAGWFNPEDGAPIKNRKISLETTQPTSMEIEGRFSKDGLQADGYWIAGACEGDWSGTKVRDSSEFQRIAFVSDRDGNDEIYSMNIFGFDQTNLTNNPASDVNPIWSPDGSQIIFASERDGNWEVYIMNADGSEPANLTDNAGKDHSASWSPDGSRIVFESDRDGDREIYVMETDGSGQSNLTNNPADDSNPWWSPAGDKIVFLSQRDGNLEIYAMNSDGSGQINLSNNPESDHSYSLSPDGTQIAFTSLQQLPDASYAVGELFLVNIDGSGLTNLTEIGGWHQVGPAWSPDGSLIVFSSFDVYNTSSCLLDVNDVDDSYYCFLDGGMNYTWSPDSKMIAYECYQNGSSEKDICIISISGLQEKYLTDQPDFSDTDPAWSP